MSTVSLPNSTPHKKSKTAADEEVLQGVIKAHADYIRAREKRREVLIQAKAAGVSMQKIADAMWCHPNTISSLIKVPARDLEFLEGMDQ